MQQMTATPATRSISIRRRSLLAGGGATALIAGMGLGAATTGTSAEGAQPPVAFVEISRFVTGSHLDDAHALARAWSQLTTLDAMFADAVLRLHGAVKDAGLTAMPAFLSSSLGKDAALVKTATTIISAFYLGFTGTPVDHRVKDNTGFVTFAGALMWRPTIDMTVIPTFARGGTDYWVAPPAGIPTPPGASGQPDWQGSTPSSQSSKA
jgi:hypothetical protein